MLSRRSDDTKPGSPRSDAARAATPDPTGPDDAANGERAVDEEREPEEPADLPVDADEEEEDGADDDDTVVADVADEEDLDDDDEEEEDAVAVVAAPVPAARPARPTPGRPPSAKDEPEPPFFVGERVRLVQNTRPRTGVPIGAHPVGAEGRVETVLSLTCILRFDGAPDTKEVVAFTCLESIDDDAQRRRAARDAATAARRAEEGG